MVRMRILWVGREKVLRVMLTSSESLNQLASIRKKHPLKTHFSLVENSRKKVSPVFYFKEWICTTTPVRLDFIDDFRESSKNQY